MNEEIKGKVREMAESEGATQEMKAVVAMLKEEIERGHCEIREMRRKEEEMTHKIKKDSEALEFMVDRRIINKFLVNYANPTSSFEVKL
jgi:ribosome recycling factor